MSCTISIINHNDKSGKTIIAFNLAVALSLYGRKTLFLNSFDDLISSKELIEKNKKGSLDLPGKRLLGIKKFQACKSFLSNLDFLTIDHDVNLEENGDEIEALSDEIKSGYDYVIVDCPSGLNGGLDLFYRISDKYIVPLETESAAFDALPPLFAKSGWMKNKGYNPEFLGFLLNRVTKSSRLYNLFAKSSFYLFGSHVLESVIPYCELIDLTKNKSGSILDDIISLPGVSFLKLAEYIHRKNGGIQ